MHHRDSELLNELRKIFSDSLQENVRLSNYTTSRVGGVADGLLVANTSDEIAYIVKHLFDLNIPMLILGSGANVLISDNGYRGVAIINKAKSTKINVQTTPPSIWAESGANLSSVARQAAMRSLSGLEWAVTIPGTVGGAVYGNAGAFGSDIQTNLLMADILHPTQGRVQMDCQEMDYGYRSSVLKRNPERVAILSATFQMVSDTKEDIDNRMADFMERRRRTQPPGASMGSMFKNPPGDYAGRLIESAGLKGHRLGGAQISPLHGNFFLNQGTATADDIWQLVMMTRKRIHEKFGVDLELEIERLGDWPEE